MDELKIPKSLELQIHKTICDQLEACLTFMFEADKEISLDRRMVVHTVMKYFGTPPVGMQKEYILSSLSYILTPKKCIDLISGYMQSNKVTIGGLNWLSTLHDLQWCIKNKLKLAILYKDAVCSSKIKTKINFVQRHLDDRCNNSCTQVENFVFEHNLVQCSISNLKPVYGRPCDKTKVSTYREDRNSHKNISHVSNYCFNVKVDYTCTDNWFRNINYRCYLNDIIEYKILYDYDKDIKGILQRYKQLETP
jgi:hypothetical protein